MAFGFRNFKDFELLDEGDKDEQVWKNIQQQKSLIKKKEMMKNAINLFGGNTYIFGAFLCNDFWG